MYCIKCGVELTEGQSACPICNTAVLHPDFPVDTSKAPYPVKEFKSDVISTRGLLFAISIILLLPVILPIIFEILTYSTVSWSGFVAGGIIVFYTAFILPFWFKNPNPVIFTPCGFLALGLYVYYICLVTGGDWFFTFALPVLLGFGVIISTMVALIHYLRHGKLYIFGGGIISLGILTVLIEFLLYKAFYVVTYVKWSIFSFTSLFIIGILLILIEIIKPFKEALKKMFYI